MQQIFSVFTYKRNAKLFLISQNIHTDLKGPKIKYIICAMIDVRGDVLRPPHGTTPAEVKANKNKNVSSFKSNENIHSKEDGSFYVVSANKASSVTL